MMNTSTRPVIVFLASVFALISLARKTDAGNNLNLDLQAFIDQQLAAGSKHIVIPPGRYRVTPHNREHLSLNDLNDVEIIADGVEMVCTQTTRALSINHCSNLHFRGMTIDYDPLPFTQGRIVAMADDKSWLQFKIDQGFPEQKLVERIEIFDGHTRQLKSPTRYNWGKFQPMGNHVYRVNKTGDYHFNPSEDLEEVGDVLVTNNEYAPDGAEPHAIVDDHGKGVTLENITLYASNCFGYFEEDCDGNKYLHCSVDRRALTNDPVQRAEARVRSTDADAFHSKFAAKGPSLISCLARFQGDDGLNICGEFHVVTACKGNILRVLGDRHLGVGEGIEIFTYQGVRPPDATITAIEPEGDVTEDEHAFMAKQHMNSTYKSPSWNPRAFRITIDRDLHLSEGSVIASTQRVGNGFLVQDCNFSFNRSRGILIKASNGRVINNTMEGNWGEAIKVSPEFWWLEAGSSCNVIVSGNHVHDCRTTAIAIYANGGDDKIAPSGAHRNITVAHNQVGSSPLPNVVVTSTDGLILGENLCDQPDGVVSPGVLGSLGLTGQPPATVMTVNCTNVTHSSN